MFLNGAEHMKVRRYGFSFQEIRLPVDSPDIAFTPLVSSEKRLAARHVA